MPVVTDIFWNKQLSPGIRNTVNSVCRLVFSWMHIWTTFHRTQWLQTTQVHNEQIAKAPPRKERFLLRLQKYDFDLEYTKGQLIKVTDTLTRVALQDYISEISDKEMNYFIYFMMSSFPISEKTRQKQVSETAKDDTQMYKNYDIKILLDDQNIVSNTTPVSDNTITITQ